ncbi:MAG: PilN domain-containing protein [Deltaproteobacteria bacterium]
MIKINLLPYRETGKRDNITRQIALIAVSFIALVIVIGAIHLFVSFKIGGLENDVKDQEEKLAKLTKVIGDIEGYKRNKAILEKKLAIINSLEENRLAPVRMLDELSGLVPVKDIWLEKLTEKGMDITIEGVARNNIAVALFMRNLAGARFIKSVDLLSTKEKEVSGIKLQQFVVSCVKKGS